MEVNLKKMNKTFEKKMGEMIKRSTSMQTFLQRKILPAYFRAQKTRWQTENESEGSKWKELNSEYKKDKKTRYADYYGGGRKMMVATGSLFKAVIGEGSGFRKTITNKSFIVGIDAQDVAASAGASNLNYPIEANMERPFMNFSDKTIDSFKQAIRDYIKAATK